MVGHRLHVGDPVRVHRPTGLERTADPRAEIFLPLLGARMNGVVHEHEADSGLGELIGLFPALADDAGGIRVDDDGSDAVEHAFVFGPALNHCCLDIQPALFVEGFGKQQAAGVELVVAGRVAARSGEKQDLVLASASASAVCSSDGASAAMPTIKASSRSGEGISWQRARV